MHAENAVCGVRNAAWRGASVAVYPSTLSWFLARGLRFKRRKISASDDPLAHRQAESMQSPEASARLIIGREVEILAVNLLSVRIPDDLIGANPPDAKTERDDLSLLSRFALSSSGVRQVDSARCQPVT